MSKQGFTPGPWTLIERPVVDYGPDARCFVWEIRGPDNNPSSNYSWPVRICQNVQGVYSHEPSANARLIAAAPDLYAALGAVKAKYDFGDTLPDDHPIAMVRAALTKATGGA